MNDDALINMKKYIINEENKPILLINGEEEELHAEDIDYLTLPKNTSNYRQAGELYYFRNFVGIRNPFNSILPEEK